MFRRPKLKILVTAGPTREHLDALRYLSNPSSGRMGFEVARAGRDLGHRVTLVAGPTGLRPPLGVRLLPVTSGEEMRRAVARFFPRSDALVMTAAVADFRPARRARGKIPRKGARVLRLVPTADIVGEAGRRKGRRRIVGFALEVGPGGPARARRKLAAKKLDLLVLNGPENLGGASGRFTLLAPGLPPRPLGRLSKRALARLLVRWLASPRPPASRPAPSRP